MSDARQTGYTLGDIIAHSNYEIHELCSTETAHRLKEKASALWCSL